MNTFNWSLKGLVIACLLAYTVRSLSTHVGQTSNAESRGTSGGFSAHSGYPEKALMLAPYKRPFQTQQWKEREELAGVKMMARVLLAERSPSKSPSGVELAPL